jgi:hypothetical protein
MAQPKTPFNVCTTDACLALIRRVWSMSYNILHLYWVDLVKILEHIIKLMLADVFTVIGSTQKKNRI